MYKSKIFLTVKDKEDLISLEETSYLNENILQELLAKYPDLLPGDQIDPENPRRWLFISREIRVPGNENEAGRWSLDHLFLDQDGIPTFVECKRSNDTRIRREVVAQMLDYAANGIKYWDVDRLREYAAEVNPNLEATIVELLGESEKEIDIDAYWEQVNTNLKNRRVRLIFVADKTPKELRNLVEFLNEEMKNIEVLAVEIKQFQTPTDSTRKALVPRVVGLTEANRKPPGGNKKKTTEKEFLEKCNDYARKFFKSILRKSKEKGLIIYWGTVGFSVRFESSNMEKIATFSYCYPPDEYQFYTKGWIDSEEAIKLKDELTGKCNSLKSVGVYTLNARIDENNLNEMMQVYEIVLEKIMYYSK